MAKSYNFLIVEDSEAHSVLFSRYIKRGFNCKISNSTTVADAINQIKSTDFDLILLDYMLDDSYGIEFLKQIQKDNIHVPVVFVTGIGNEEVATEAMSMGAYDYIAKHNVNENSLARSIHNALDKFKNKMMILEQQKELQQFAHTISHDLGAVLGRINAYSRMLRAKLKQSKLGQELTNDEIKKIGEHAAKIERDSAYSLDFVRNILEFAECGRKDIELVDVDLNQVIDRAIANIELHIQKSNAVIEYEALPNIKGHQLSLIQLFQNLISNAIKYCDGRPVIRISSENKEGVNVISFTDNGIGIDEEKLDKDIFQAFTRASDHSGGFGLGLSFCQSIVNMHKGRIYAKSKLGQGSTFFVEIPDNKNVYTTEQTHS